MHRGDLEVRNLRRRLPSAGASHLRLRAIDEVALEVASARERLRSERAAAQQAFHECELAYLRMQTSPAAPPYRDRHLEGRRTRYRVAGWIVTSVEILTAIALTWWTLNLSPLFSVAIGLVMAIAFTACIKTGLTSLYGDEARPEDAVASLKRMAVWACASSAVLLLAFLLVRSFDRFPVWAPVAIGAFLEIALVFTAGAFFAVVDALGRPATIHRQYVEADHHLAQLEAFSRQLADERARLVPRDADAPNAATRPGPSAALDGAVRNHGLGALVIGAFLAATLAGGAGSAHAREALVRIYVDRSGSLLPADEGRVANELSTGLPAIVKALGGVDRIEIHDWDGTMASALAGPTAVFDLPRPGPSLGGAAARESDLFRLRAERVEKEREEREQAATQASCLAAGRVIRELAAGASRSPQTRVRELVRWARRSWNSGGVYTILLTDGVSEPREALPAPSELERFPTSPVTVLLVASRRDGEEVLPNLDERARSLRLEGHDVAVVTSAELSGDWSFLLGTRAAARSSRPSHRVPADLVSAAPR